MPVTIEDVGAHFFDVRDSETGFMTIFEQWSSSFGSRGNQGYVFEMRYDLFLANRRSGQRLRSHVVASRPTPVITQTQELPVPTLDEAGNPIEDGTYAANISVELWRVTPGKPLYIGTATTSATVFIVSRDYEALTIALPDQETRALASVTNSLHEAHPEEETSLAGVIIPPGAVAEPTLITVSEVNLDANSDLRFGGQAGAVYDFGPDIEFARPVTVMIPYEPSANEESRTREIFNVAVVYQNGNWVSIPSQTDIFTSTITAATTHFTSYSSSLGLLTRISSYDVVFNNMMSGVRDNFYRLTSNTSILDFEPESITTKTAEEWYGSSSLYDSIELLAYLETLNAVSARHILDIGRTGSRKARLKELVKLGLRMAAYEAQNYHHNSGNNSGPYTGLKPNGAPAYGGVRYVRGWPRNDLNTGSTTYRGWQSFAAQNSKFMIALFSASMAIQLENIETADGGELVFTQDEAQLLRDSGRFSINDVAGTPGAVVCGNQPLDHGVLDLSTLTYAGASWYFARLAEDVLRWSIECTMSINRYFSFFWYLSHPQSASLAWGNTGRYLDEVVIQNTNVSMGRAAFLAWKIFPNRTYSDYRLSTQRSYYSLAYESELAFYKAQYPCYGPTGSVMTCYNYGSHEWHFVLDNPPYPAAWANTGTVDESYTELEDWGHLYASVALLGLINGDSLYNSVDLFGDTNNNDITNVSLMFRNTYRTYNPLGEGCETYVFWLPTGGPVLTNFQCTNAFHRWHNADGKVINAQLPWRKDVSRWQFKIVPELFPKYPITVNGKVYVVPDFRGHDEVIQNYYLAEGTGYKIYELLYQWADAWARLTPPWADSVGKPDVNAFKTFQFVRAGAFLAWSAHQRELGRKISVPGLNPSIASLSPSQGALGTTLRLTGTNFGGYPFPVQMGSSAASPITQRTTEIQVAVPTDAPFGPLAIQVNRGGFKSNTLQFTVMRPQISSLNPAKGSGAAGETLTLSGAYFGTRAGTVSVGGSPALVLAWTDASVMVSLPELPLGTHALVLTDSFGRGTATAPFEVPPVVNTVTPTQASAGETVTLTGRFGSSPGVMLIGGVAVATAWTPSTIVATVPSSGTAGNWGNEIQAAGLVARFNLTVLPHIDQVSLVRYAGQAYLRVVGSNFGSSVDRLSFAGGRVRNPNILEWSPTEIQFTAKSSLGTGTYLLSVEVNQARSNEYSLAIPFLARLDSVSPSRATGGNPIVISGVFAAEPGLVSIAGINASSSWSNSRIEAPMPNDAPSGRQVGAVFTAGQELRFDITVAPSIVSIAETPEGKVGVHGTNLVPFGMVYADGTAVMPLSWTGNDFVLDPAPFRGPGAKSVVVNVNGEPSNSVAFRLAPKLTDVTPALAPVGTNIVIEGVNLLSATPIVVQIGGQQATVVTSSGTQIVATVPATLDAGTYSLEVVVDGVYRSNPLTLAVSTAISLQMVQGGIDHTCLIAAGGAVYCWGNNQWGQLGTGDFVTRPDARQVMGLPAPAKELALALYSSCALLTTGEVWCWGSNLADQLGAPDYQIQVSPLPRQVALEGIKAIAAGYNYYCVISSDDRAQCWGDNVWRQLGSSTPSTSWGLYDVDGITGGVTAITGGGGSACAIVNGAVWCWGLNNQGQAGVPVESAYSDVVPHPVSGVSAGATMLTGGQYHHCAMFADGSIECWGDNRSGQLGDGTLSSRDTGAKVQNLPLVRQIAAHITNSHTCAVTYNGQVYCWGNNYFGQLGYDPFSLTLSALPIAVPNLASVQSMGTGYLHSCAIHSQGTGLKCWGSNRSYQLGVASPALSYDPIEVWLGAGLWN